jgi:hypothetical protein
MRQRGARAGAWLLAAALSHVYDVGYSVAEFIVGGWGRPALPALIAAHGDTQAVLGLALVDFESGWFAFVRARHAL